MYDNNDLDFIKKVIDIVNNNDIQIFKYKRLNSKSIWVKKAFKVKSSKVNLGYSTKYRSSDLPTDLQQKINVNSKPTRNLSDVVETLNSKVVQAPLTGVFYSSPSPENPPFAKIGDKVLKGSTLCIIEAMKVMNEIKSPFNGIVSQVLVKNGGLIEFGQPLFKIDL